MPRTKFRQCPECGFTNCDAGNSCQRYRYKRQAADSATTFNEWKPPNVETGPASTPNLREDLAGENGFSQPENQPDEPPAFLRGMGQFQGYEYFPTNSAYESIQSADQDTRFGSETTSQYTSSQYPSGSSAYESVAPKSAISTTSEMSVSLSAPYNSNYDWDPNAQWSLRQERVAEVDPIDQKSKLGLNWSEDPEPVTRGGGGIRATPGRSRPPRGGGQTRQSSREQWDPEREQREGAMESRRRKPKAEMENQRKSEMQREQRNRELQREQRNQESERGRRNPDQDQDIWERRNYDQTGYWPSEQIEQKSERRNLNPTAMQQPKQEQQRQRQQPLHDWQEESPNQQSEEWLEPQSQSKNRREHRHRKR